MSHDSIAPTLHAYCRISDPTQRKGGGLDRQLKMNVEGFCSLHGFTMSKRIWVDDGVSAWKGLNATPEHELGKFIAEANKGLIRPGDCLLVENYDRLSRQDPFAAIGLVSALRDLRIHVGRLDRMKLLRYDSTDPGDFFECAIELMRGNSESNAKSMRNGEKWQKRKGAAREKGETITKRLPGWIVERDGRREAIPEHVETIKRIFKMSANGYGQHLIVTKFSEEGVPTFGTSGHWTRGYIALLLKDRRVLGEFQPRRIGGKPDGEVIKGYFPVVVGEDEWYAARYASNMRKRRPGRHGKYVNVFAGSLKNALEGDSYTCETREDKGKKRRVLFNANGAEGRAKKLSFPFATFEKAILEKLREIDPHEILNGDTGPDETAVLAGQLAEVTNELQEAKAWMDANKFSPAIAERITKLEDKQRDLGGRLAAARQKAAHPQSEAWGESKTLMDAINTAADPNDVRLRLKSVLQKMIASIQLLVVPRGVDRLAAVQIWFKDKEEHRDYLIYHRAARGNASARTEGGWWCRSLLMSNLPGVPDFRDRNTAHRLEAVLSHMELEEHPLR